MIVRLYVDSELVAQVLFEVTNKALVVRPINHKTESEPLEYVLASEVIVIHG